MCRVCSPENMVGLALGEITGLYAALLRWHLRACAACRQEFESVSDSVRRARTLKAPDASPLLQERIWSEIAAVIPGSRRAAFCFGTPRRFGAVSVLRLGALGVVAAAFALLFLPSRAPSRMSGAAEIHQAVSRINTWHLKGWKLQNGRKILWEVWGRRSPFFYREQAGADLVVDDGRRRVSMFAPPDRSNGQRSRGVVLITSSMPGPDNVRWSYERIAGLWNGDICPAERSAAEEIYNFPESGILSGGPAGTVMDRLYYVPVRTRLPRRYEARLGKPDARQTTALLDAEYDRPIPDAAMIQPASPTDYTTYDAIQPPLIGPNMATVNGITVQATPLVVSSDGIVLLQVKSWIGGMLTDGTGPLTVDIAAERWVEPNAMITPANMDEQMRPYTQVSWDRLGEPMDRSTSLIVLAPVDPIAPGGAPAGQLSVRFDVAPRLDSRLNGTMGMIDSQLSRHDIVMTVAMPPQTGPLSKGLVQVVDPNWEWRVHWFDHPETLASATDFARASFYGFITDRRRLDRPHLLSALAYYEKYFRESPCASSVAMCRTRAATLSHLLGDDSRARQLLRDVLNDSRLDTLYRSIGKDLPTSMSPEQRRAWIEENRDIVAGYRQSARMALSRLPRDR